MRPFVRLVTALAATLACGCPHDRRDTAPPAPSAAPSPLDAGAASAPTSVSVAPIAEAELADARAVVAAVAQKESSYPRDARIEIAWTGGGPRAVVGGGTARIVLPVRITFDAHANAYCRIALFDPRTRSATLVPQMPDFDQCEGMDKVAESDLDGDGIPDFAFDVRVPSNREPVTVAEGAVYLSRGAAGSYCFASRLGALVPGASTATELQSAIRRAVARHGSSMLDCWRDRWQ